MGGEGVMRTSRLFGRSVWSPKSIPGEYWNRLVLLPVLLAPLHGRLTCCGATPGRRGRTHINGSRSNTFSSHHTQSSRPNRCVFCHTPSFLFRLHTPSSVAHHPSPPPFPPPFTHALVLDSHGAALFCARSLRVVEINTCSSFFLSF